MRYERMQGRHKRIVRVKAPEGKGVNWLITKDDRQVFPDADGIYEVAEEDAAPLYATGWRELN